ncbi:MAG: helix-turn-helix domain-containing protein [Candidatus Synoicihabitans palmerolidicus]|nr:helix-turn-helix domain-containing protein [Candidatus Synoicihabitans palmerolidicus]MCC5025906.1 helix-turn-helix domain-containing protein [Candidatus Synoicihabitans palmerolidicus]MCC5025986.1 helix-turn-helix domain-containing protein [Candidatus Synoicihabitans palmerolidicus]
MRPEERDQLEEMIRQPKAQARYVERARIVLWAAEGQRNKQIAQRLGTREARVSRWRTRFEREGLEGLHDAPRLGRPPRKEGEDLQARVLAPLDEPRTRAGRICPLERRVVGPCAWQCFSRSGLVRAAPFGHQPGAPSQLVRFDRSAVFRQGRRCRGTVPGPPRAMRWCSLSTQSPACKPWCRPRDTCACPMRGQ